MTDAAGEWDATNKFLLTCLLRGMTVESLVTETDNTVSTHMPLARHDHGGDFVRRLNGVSTHMPLARHDIPVDCTGNQYGGFYSHASCEA